jgi:hypothetical protein
MRFEDASIVTAIAAFTIVVGMAFALQQGAPRELAPIVLVAIAVGVISFFVWIIGYIRTERALGRIRTEPPPRSPRWKSVLAIGAGLLAGVVYWRSPENGRLFSYGLFIAAVFAFIWVQVRSRRRRSGR